jgi:hypothetical protein
MFSLKMCGLKTPHRDRRGMRGRHTVTASGLATIRQIQK